MVYLGDVDGLLGDQFISEVHGGVDEVDLIFGEGGGVFVLVGDMESEDCSDIFDGVALFAVDSEDPVEEEAEGVADDVEYGLEDLDEGDHLDCDGELVGAGGECGGDNLNGEEGRGVLLRR